MRQYNNVLANSSSLFLYIYLFIMKPINYEDGGGKKKKATHPLLRPPLFYRYLRLSDDNSSGGRQ